MKNLRILSFALIATLFFTSCSSDDDDGGNNNNDPETGNFYPLTVDDYWNYDIEVVDNLDAMNNMSASDFLFVDSQVGSTYDLGVNTNDIANGTMSGILANGLLTRSESTLEIDGSLQLPLEEFGDFSIDFVDIVLYDLNASNNDELSSSTGNFTEDFQGTPITVTYKLTTTDKGNSNSLTVNGTSYSNITKSNLKVELSIVATIEVNGSPANFTILDLQDVVSIDNYFVENVGLIKSESDITYELNATTLALLQAINVTINVPTALDVENDQELNSYQVAE